MASFVTQLFSGGCVLLAAFSVYGFLAAFEPGVSGGWRVGYLLLFVLCLTGASGSFLPPAGGSQSDDPSPGHRNPRPTR